MYRKCVAKPRDFLFYLVLFDLRKYNSIYVIRIHSLVCTLARFPISYIYWRLNPTYILHVIKLRKLFHLLLPDFCWRTRTFVLRMQIERPAAAFMREHERSTDRIPRNIALLPYPRPSLLFKSKKKEKKVILSIFFI